MKKFAVPALLILFLSLPALSQLELMTSLALKISEPIEIDGNLEEPGWRNAVDASELMQFKAEEGTQDPFNTVVKILYDSDSIYFGFQCYDSEPDKIRARMTDKDQDLRNDDSVYVLMDVISDTEHFYYFGTNLLGSQLDGRITLDGQRADVKWNGTWRAASQKTDFGWSVEIAVDLSSFGFDPKENIVVGLSLSRIVARQPMSIFWEGPLDPAFKISLLGEMDRVDLIKEIKRVKVTPHLISSAQAEEDSWVEWGLDLPYSFSQRVAARLTLNPDFYTVEPDQELINLTRFEVYLPEKRDYFKEGSSLYEQSVRLFYSKRIPMIYGGLKLIGRTRGLEFSGMHMYSKSDTYTGDDPAHFSLVRLRQNISKESSIGILATNKLIDGMNIGTAGVDASFQLTRTLNVSGQFAGSYGEFNSGNLAYFLRPSYDSRNWHFHIGYFHLGENFGDNVNQVGYIPDDNRREVDSGLGITFLRNKGFLSQVRYNSNYNVYWGMDDTLRSWQVDQGFRFDLKSKFTLIVLHTEEFKAQDDVLFERDFRNKLTKFGAGFNLKEWDYFSAYYSFGQNFGSRFDMFEIGKNLRLSKTVAVEIDLARIFFYGTSPRNQFVLWMNGLYNFSENFYAKVLFQGNSLIDKLNLEVQLTYRLLRPHGFAHLVYQSGRSRFGEEETLGSTLFLKFNYTF